jgi:recyclin-1
LLTKVSSTASSQDEGLAFEAMDEFMHHVVDALKKEGAQAVRVFPRDSRVLLALADRIANDVVRMHTFPAP